MRWTEEEYADYTAKRGGVPGKKTGRQAKPGSKYRAVKTWIDGICFDSKKEAEFYGTLKALQRAGAIKGFCRQARFVVAEGTDRDSRAAEYVTDFIVFENDGGCKIIDVKGMQTEQFKLKMKLFRERFPGLTVELI